MENMNTKTIVMYQATPATDDGPCVIARQVVIPHDVKNGTNAYLVSIWSCTAVRDSSVEPVWMSRTVSASKFGVAAATELVRLAVDAFYVDRYQDQMIYDVSDEWPGVSESIVALSSIPLAVTVQLLEVNLLHGDVLAGTDMTGLPWPNVDRS